MRGGRAYEPAFPPRIISPSFGIGLSTLSVSPRGRFETQTVLPLLSSLSVSPSPATTFRDCLFFTSIAPQRERTVAFSLRVRGE